MRRRWRRRRRWSVKAKCLATFCVLLVLFLMLDAQLRPVMMVNACSLSKSAAINAINSGISQTLEALPSEYSDLITVDYDDAGQIRSLQANAAAVNRIKSETNICVVQSMESIGVEAFAIPLGTLCGIAFFSGKGPPVRCHLLVGSSPIVTLDSELTSAGINQTLHQINMHVTVPLTVTLPLQSDNISVETTFLLAQTVLVGDVPDSYTDVISDPQLVGDIFDYADIE